jgi:hypothetical protein
MAFATKIFTLFFIITQLYGQSLTTAGFRGRVTAVDGTILKSANITATHIPTQTISGTVSLEDGYFYIPNLTPGGPYRLNCNFIGYHEARYDEIFLALGENKIVNFIMEPKTLTMEAVTVTGDRTPESNRSVTGIVTHISEEMIDLIPGIDRSLHDFTRLSSKSFGYSFAAKHPNFNTIKLDGTVLNDVYGLADNGLPGGHVGLQPVSLDAVEQIEISIAPFDVRQYGFTGGAVNAITRSGTNSFSGSVYSFFRNHRLVGTYKDGLDYPDFTEQTYGYRFSGPLKRDRLFFFINGEFSVRDIPNSVSLDTSNTNRFLGNPDDVIRVYNILKNQYGYDPGDYAPITREKRSIKLFSRLDYHMSSNHRISLRHQYLQGRDETNDRSQSRFYLGNGGYIGNTLMHSVVGNVYSAFSSNISNIFTLSYMLQSDDRDMPGQSFPAIRVQSGNYDIMAGNEQYASGTRLDQHYVVISNQISVFLGKHTINAGFKNERYRFYNGFFPSINGYYEFNNPDSLASGSPSMYWLTYSLIPGEKMPFVDWKSDNLGLYIQDTWDITDQFRLTTGIRMDMTFFHDVPLANDTLKTLFSDKGLENDRMPENYPNVSPRLGFNYRTGLSRLETVRGGVGLFAGDPKFLWLSNSYNYSGMLTNTVYTYSPPPFNPDVDSQWKPSDSGYQKAEIDIADPKLRFPKLFRLNLAADFRMADEWLLTADVMYSRNIHELYFQEMNLAGPTHTMTDGRPYFKERFFADKFHRIMYLKDTDKGYQWNASVELKGTGTVLGTHYRTLMSYTLSRAVDISSMVSSQNYSNWRYNAIRNHPNNPEITTSLYEIKHRFTGNINWTFPLFKHAPTILSVLYEGHSGAPFSYVYTGDYNGDGSAENDLIYIPESADEIVLLSGHWDKLSTFIEKDDYLRKNRGKIMERNGANLPWTHRIDLRITQFIPLLQNQQLSLNLDLINLGNLLNSSWGLVRYQKTGYFPLLKFKGFETPGDPASRPVLEFDDSLVKAWLIDDMASRWLMQVGVRLEF